MKARVDFVGTGGSPVLKDLGLRCNGDAARARTVLGWYPKRNEFLLNSGRYYSAWEASENQ